MDEVKERVPDEIFSRKIPIEVNTQNAVIRRFANKQGGADNVFSYHWQAFAWAAVVGFIYDERKPLGSPKDKVFSLNTMNGNEGDKVAQALVCMCVAKAGNLEILKNPEEAINLIAEYANGGFYLILKMLDNGELSGYNDVEMVKSEIFSRQKNE